MRPGSNSRRACPRTIPGKSPYPHSCRWAVYDLEWSTPEGGKRSKLVFIMYSPDDNADNTEKFITACNKDRVKSKMSEVNLDW